MFKKNWMVHVCVRAVVNGALLVMFIPLTIVVLPILISMAYANILMEEWSFKKSTTRIKEFLKLAFK